MTGRPLVLATTEIREPYRSALEADYTLTFDPQASDGVRAVIAASSCVVDGEMLERFPDLGLICLIGSGYEGVDLDACRIDETGASTKMARRHGRAPRGQRLRCSVPHGHWIEAKRMHHLRRRPAAGSL